MSLVTGRGRVKQAVSLMSGWRVAAAAGLTVVTAVVLVAPPPTTGTRSNRSSVTPAAAPAPAAHDHTLKDDDTGASDAVVLADSAALPPGPDFATRGGGTFEVVPGRRASTPAAGAVRYSVSVEAGVGDVDAGAFSDRVFAELTDPRGWARSGRGFEQVDGGPVDWQVTLASPMTVRALCGYEIPVETSCWEPNAGRVVINLARWVRGSAAYVGDTDLYRTYMLNHEIAHARGHGHAHECLADGRAPVMMQQTVGTRSTTGQLCRPNPWPYPDGVTDAPGAEQPDTDQNSEYAMISD